MQAARGYGATRRGYSPRPAAIPEALATISRMVAESVVFIDTFCDHAFATIVRRAAATWTHQAAAQERHHKSLGAHWLHVWSIVIVILKHLCELPHICNAPQPFWHMIPSPGPGAL